MSRSGELEMSTDQPSLADRMELTRIVIAGDGQKSILYQGKVSDEDRIEAATRLRKLDKIESVVGEDGVLDLREIAAALSTIVDWPHEAVWLRRLAAALDDGNN